MTREATKVSGTVIPAEPAGTTATVELALDSHRITGDIEAHNQARLVDLLNSADDHYLRVTSAQMDDPHVEGDEPRSFDVTEVHRDSIAFAVPLGAMPGRNDPFADVEKEPVEVTFLLPGFEITGNLYLIRGADPLNTRVLGQRHFVPLTDATVKSASGRERVWQEDVVIVNTARAYLYAPHARRSR